MSFKKPKMEISLVTQFDDLVRKAKILQTGCEAEFVAFASNQDEARKKWLNAEQKNESLEDRLKRAESQVASLDTQLKHARMQAEYELQRRKAAEREKDDMDRQIGVIRELLNDKNGKSILHENDRDRLAAIANSHRQSVQMDASNTRLNTIMEHSASFLSDVSFDKTEEDPLHESRLRNGKKFKRPSAPPAEEMDNTPPKRQKDEIDHHNNSIVTAVITIDAAGKPSATIETNMGPKLNKSFSEPSLDKRGNGGDSGPESDDEFYAQSHKSSANRNFNAQPRKSILKSTPETPTLRKANSAGRGLNRVHIFISKTVIKPEICVPCGKRIRFSKPAMKCKDCRAVCHPECKDKLPLPCIPSCPSTPGFKQSEGLIADYAPSERPMIPRLIVNCANEIENRGLQEVGIYRVPGSDKDQKELKEKFVKGRSPNLSQIHDIHVVCGCLKEFLRSLKEPLVTFALWPKFVEATDIRSSENCQEELCKLVNCLPQANKDTLAFLVQHLQIVANTPTCKMPASNLAKVFGPTVVGYSCAEPEPMQIMNETRRQNQVMERLLQIPTDFWADLLVVDEVGLYPSGTPYTPDSVQYGLRSMLGPLNTPERSDIYGHDIKRSATTPRYATKAYEPRRPARFFDSPIAN